MVPTAPRTVLAVHLVGRAAKRGLIPRLPTGERLLADCEAWLQADYADVVGVTRRRVRPSGAAELVLSAHPAATEVVLIADDAARVEVTADTAAPGPGYHTFVGRLLARLGADLSIEWQPPDADGTPAADVTNAGPPPTAVVARPAVERSYLAWLGARLAGARDARSAGRPPVHVATPPGVRFTVDAPVVTPLGPRDDAWLERALADWHAALDIVPWWADATDARYLLNRALCLMWTEVRWRSPASPAERAALDEVARLLRRALPLDPALAYPWQTWLELLDLRGVDDAVARQVAVRAAATPADEVPIGYRRRPVTVTHAGWTLEVPGSFTEQRSDEEWTGGEGGRTVTLAAVETGRDGEPMSPEAFLDLVAGELGPDALVHRDGPLTGRARLHTDGSSGVEVGVLDAYSAVPGSGAAIRIVFENPADWEWSLATWRGLAPP